MNMYRYTPDYYTVHTYIIYILECSTLIHVTTHIQHVREHFAIITQQHTYNADDGGDNDDNDDDICNDNNDNSDHAGNDKDDNDVHGF